MFDFSSRKASTTSCKVLADHRTSRGRKGVVGEVEMQLAQDKPCARRKKTLAPRQRFSSHTYSARCRRSTMRRHDGWRCGPGTVLAGRPWDQPWFSHGAGRCKRGPGQHTSLPSTPAQSHQACLSAFLTFPLACLPCDPFSRFSHQAFSSTRCTFCSTFSTRATRRSREAWSTRARISSA